MREIRTFELDHGEPATAWRVARPLTLQVMARPLSSIVAHACG
jgi:hypothetical protein